MIIKQTIFHPENMLWDIKIQKQTKELEIISLLFCSRRRIIS